MRHAVSKLAHIHFAATPASAQRLIRMGERPEDVHVTGSPARDGRRGLPPPGGPPARGPGDPRAVVLLHPAGLPPDDEARAADAAAHAAFHSFGSRVLVLAPNHDPGRTIIKETLQMHASNHGWRSEEHLARGDFLGLLKRLAVDPSGPNGPSGPGVLIGNSSAGLIEASATRTPTVNIGPRQGGRERAANVVDCERPTPESVARAVAQARAVSAADLAAANPYGDGDASHRIAQLLAGPRVADPALTRKRNTY